MVGHRSFLPPEPWTLVQAHKEVSEAAIWARQTGHNRVAPRLEWAARLLKEEINKAMKANETPEPTGTDA